MVDICAVIAALNEARHIAAVVADARRHVREVVVVDDGSSDGTAAAARAAGATVLAHDRNLGKGCAVRSGIDYVLGRPFSHVLLIDGDLQHDPAEIPKLVAQAERGIGDFVLAEREFEKASMPPARFYSNVIGSRILSRFIGADVADSQSGFRLIRTEWLREVELTATGYEIETEMLIKLVRAGARVERVTVRRLQYEGARSKMRPVRDTFRTCMLAVYYRYLSSS